MQINGIINSNIKEVQPKQNQPQSVNGTSFMESMVNTALRADSVTRGNEVYSSKLSSKIMTEEWNEQFEEEEDSIMDIFKKLDKIEDILKENNGK
jgi:hypothetical protein